MTTDPMMVEVAWCPGTFSGNGHPMRPTCDQPGSECVVAHVPQVRRGIVAPGSRTALVLAVARTGSEWLRLEAETGPMGDFRAESEADERADAAEKRFRSADAALRAHDSAAYAEGQRILRNPDFDSGEEGGTDAR